MHIAEFAERFQGWTKRGDKVFCLCPAHADKNPSLQVSRKPSGRILLHCFAGCETQDVLDVVGLQWADLEPEGSLAHSFDKTKDDKIPLIELLDGSGIAPAPKEKPRIVAEYDYYDDDGVLLLQVLRTEPKSFRQRRPHPDKPGQWIWKTKDVRRTLYRLPQLLEADPDTWIVFAEGEKNVERLVSLGFESTTNMGGAGVWEDSYPPYFKDRRVAIVPDNDKAGHAHAQRIAEEIHAETFETRIVTLPGLRSGQDVFDWIEKQESDADAHKELMRLIEAAEMFNGLPLPVISIAQLMKMELPIDWLVSDIIPRGSAGGLVGPSAAGKTWVLLDLALAMATGGKWLGHFSVTEGGVLIIDEENALPLLKSRLGKMIRRQGLDVSDLPVHFLAGHQLDLTPHDTRKERVYPEDHFRLIDVLQELRPRLICIDSLTRVHRVDEKNANEIAAVFAGFKDLMHQTGTAVMFTHHFRKASSENIGDLIRGSTDIRAWCDWTVIVNVHRQDIGILSLNVIHDKSRYGEPIPRFRSVLTSTWTEKDEQKIGFIYEGEVQAGRKKTNVREWIIEKLSGGPQLYDDLCKTAIEEEVGFKLGTLKNTLYRMRKSKDVEQTGRGKTLTWELLETADPDLAEMGRMWQDKFD